jgi:hypothetical protein
VVGKFVCLFLFFCVVQWNLHLCVSCAMNLSTKV